MARIFISYKRADRHFLEDTLLPKLNYAHEGVFFWYDKHIRGGTEWWQTILNEIAACDVFLFLLSNDALRSPYCLAEFSEALRKKKPIICAIVRSQTELPKDGLTPKVRRTLQKLQWIELVDPRGRLDSDGLIKLTTDLGKMLNQASTVIEPTDPTLEDEGPTPEPQVDDQPEKSRRLDPVIIAAIIGGIFTVLVAFIGIVPPLLEQNRITQATQDAIATQRAITGPTDTTIAFLPTVTLTPEHTPTPSPSLAIIDIVATLDAQATIDQATRNAESTIAARATAYAEQTALSLAQTATATLWTQTPTPDITASIEAFRADQTATAMAILIASYTKTPTLTFTPSLTPTPTHTPTNTLTPLEAAVRRARTPVSANADWQPFTHIFEVDGVSISMSLVPRGCFMMGTESGGDSDERPVSEACFDQPFWIDTFEVSNAQFNALNGVAGRASRRAEDERPREQITWFEARDFCVLRGDRLPTEAEWEYAARGPDALIYPWGNDFDADRVIDSSDPYGTADIGPDLRQNGRSWIGAYDLSGNVWEWVSSLYQPYPYSRDDGREADMGNRTDVLYALRGGSFDFSTDLLRGAERNWGNPNVGYDVIGFRCARSYQ